MAFRHMDNYREIEWIDIADCQFTIKHWQCVVENENALVPSFDRL